MDVEDADGDGEGNRFFGQENNKKGLKNIMA